MTEPNVHLAYVPCHNCDRRAVLRDGAGVAWCARCKFGAGSTERNANAAAERAKTRFTMPGKVFR